MRKSEDLRACGYSDWLQKHREIFPSLRPQLTPVI